MISGELKQLLSNGPANTSGISVRATNSDGAYRAGQTITIEVSFPLEVIVTGAPTLRLATGRSGSEATYVSGSGTATLLFTYTIQAGDNVAELDYFSALALSESTGSIKAQTDSPLDLTLSSPGSSGSIAYLNNIVLDTTPPTITLVSSTSANGAYKAAATVSVVATFSEPVIVTGTPEIALNSDVNAKAVYHSGSGGAGIRFDYTVGTGHTSTDLDYVSTSSLTATSILDVAGNSAVLTLPAAGGPSSLGGSKAIVVDTDQPTSISNLIDGFGIVSTTSSPITTWDHATDATSSIAAYQVAIGTTPGGTEALNWASQTAMSTATITGLTLTAGTTYYTSIRAVDAAGNIGTGTTGDGWKPVNTLVIAPATKMLVTNERYPFTASEGYPGYTYSIFSGVGSLAGNIFTAPSTAGSSVLRATDLMSSTASANVTTRQFGRITSLPPTMIDAPMKVGGAQYDSLGNLYVAGVYGLATKRLLVRKYDGTTWTTLLDEEGGQFGGVQGLLVNSSSDIWVVGTTSAFGAMETWTVKHYDGSTWTVSDTVSLSPFRSAAYGIAKGPGGEIYVVGYAEPNFGSSRWIVRKYASGSWTTLDTYQGGGTSDYNFARAVAVNSSGEVFVAGGAAASNVGYIDWVVRKYSGGAWSISETLNTGAAEMAKAIVIDSSDTVYVAGDIASAQNQIRRLSGGVWASIGEFTNAGISDESVTALALDNTGRPYVTTTGSNSSASVGFVTRYSGSGTTWELVSSINDFDITALTKNAVGEMVFAGSYNRSGFGVIDGDEWSVHKTDGSTTTEIINYQAKIIASEAILGVAFDSLGNVYVVGSVLKVANYSQRTWVVKKFDGTTWTTLDEVAPDPTNGDSAATSIYVDENDHVWVAGVSSSAGLQRWIVRKFNGTSWSTVDDYTAPGGLDSYPATISGKAGKIYVGGWADDVGGWSGMIIRRFDGTSWSTVYSDDGHQSMASINDIIVDSNGVAWAVLTKQDTAWNDNDIEVLKSSDGVTWTVSHAQTDVLYFGTTELFEGASGEIYLVYPVELANHDYVGQVMKWNGAAWSLFDQTPNQSFYNGATRDSEGNFYFVGGEDVNLMIKKWNGHYVDKVYVPTKLASAYAEELYTIVAGPNGKLIGIGQGYSYTDTFRPLIIQLEP